jgi:hypothetical protein
MPQHLPMRIMNDLLPDTSAPKLDTATDTLRRDHINLLIDELERSLPIDWLTIAYREAAKPYNQAFDRIYLRKLLERHRHNVTAAAKAANLDPKTFRERWRQSGLPPLGGEEEKPNG